MSPIMAGGGRNRLGLSAVGKGTAPTWLHMRWQSPPAEDDEEMEYPTKWNIFKQNFLAMGKNLIVCLLLRPNWELVLIL